MNSSSPNIFFGNEKTDNKSDNKIGDKNHDFCPLKIMPNFWHG
jgi:hypothetical protein